MLLAGVSGVGEECVFREFVRLVNVNGRVCTACLLAVGRIRWLVVRVCRVCNVDDRCD